jgi:non-homologous end joining protein Ku
MSVEFEPDKFEDRSENAMTELIRSKQAGLATPKEKVPLVRPILQLDGCSPATASRTLAARRNQTSASKSETAIRRKPGVAKG